MFILKVLSFFLVDCGDGQQRVAEVGGDGGCGGWREKYLTIMHLKNGHAEWHMALFCLKT